MVKKVKMAKIVKKVKKVKIVKMVKNSFISALSQEKKGSIEFQVFSFTNKINKITLHLELHKKDLSSRRGLQIILEKRKRLLVYLRNKNEIRYEKLISQLSNMSNKNKYSFRSKKLVNLTKNGS
uniref:Small ribosomal subunit protein uS15c n=1 Tax=Halophila beccarii TaxID=180123 RepID=A0A7G7YEH9_9LILI|nr:ribosomal protein S15 [Halophila beccarii]QNH92899.1 ribosomal protein S15 [Halophila beccarii]